VAPPSGSASIARQRWIGRLAATFFAGGGLLALVTLPLASPDSDREASAVVAVLACVAGVVIWFVPWERLPARATLVVVPPAFALIAFGNVFGGTDYFTYGIFFVIAFMWIGLAHPPWTSTLIAPLAFVAYLLPLMALPRSDAAAGIGSALLVLPISVLAGESLARGLDRLARTEAELHYQRTAAEELRELHAMKDAFLRAASHELRTPLTVCRGYVDLLDARPDAEELRVTVDVVTDELARMGRIVDDITTLTRLEDPAALRRAPVDVPELVQEIRAKAAPILGARLHVSDVPPGSLSADRDRITQALLNLLHNASRHAGAGASVELRAIAEPTAWRFVVADDGRGLDGADVEALFEPFRHDPASPGSGLGLAIVRAIARAHEGEAGARPLPGRGAEFWIRVPA
jgi:signal transduction histidine kinase